MYFVLANTPFDKSNGHFVRHKNQHDAFIQFAQYLVVVWKVSAHFLREMYWLLVLTRFASGSKGNERNFVSKLSLNIIVDSNEWNLTDSSKP